MTAAHRFNHDEHDVRGQSRSGHDEGARSTATASERGARPRRGGHRHVAVGAPVGNWAVGDRFCSGSRGSALARRTSLVLSALASRLRCWFASLCGGLASPPLRLTSSISAPRPYVEPAPPCRCHEGGDGVGGGWRRGHGAGARRTDRRLLRRQSTW